MTRDVTSSQLRGDSNDGLKTNTDRSTIYRGSTDGSHDTINDVVWMLTDGEKRSTSSLAAGKMVDASQQINGKQLAEIYAVKLWCQIDMGFVGYFRLEGSSPCS